MFSFLARLADIFPAFRVFPSRLAFARFSRRYETHKNMTVPMYNTVFIIKNNLRSANISREEYFTLLTEVN